jgi:hypothetical protein
MNERNIFDELVLMFSTVHEEIVSGRPKQFVRLLRTALLGGQPVIDLIELAPASSFDEAVMDDASMIIRHDLIRDLEEVLLHLKTNPAVYRRKVGLVLSAVATRGDVDVIFEDNQIVRESFRYTLIAVSGSASAFIVVFGDSFGGVRAVLRCPAGEDVISGLNPAVAALTSSIATIVLGQLYDSD